MHATLIAALSSTKNPSDERDPEMHQTKKDNPWYLDIKASIRGKVENPFRVIKREFGFSCGVRFSGQADPAIVCTERAANFEGGACVSWLSRARRSTKTTRECGLLFGIWWKR